MTDARPTSIAARLWGALRVPHDAAGIAVMRIALGVLVAISAQRFLAFGWVDRFFVRPRVFLKYWGFEWVPNLPSAWMHAVFVALAIAGVLVALGLWYRVAIAAVFVLFTYVQLVDVSTYLNHYYLVSLLAGLFCFIPAHRCWSLDAVRNPALASTTLPAWCTYLLRLQIGVVYVNAGLAKLTADWLLHAQPMQIWLSSRTDLPLIGAHLDQPVVAFIAAWAGFLFDATIVLWLSLRRTRPFAYAAVIAFHAATWIMFPIGMFPFIMTSAALVFFAPAWPRVAVRAITDRLGRVAAPASASTPPTHARVHWRHRTALAAAAVYVALQVLLPLRSHLYGGHVLWHEQGMRFSWRVMAREKNGSVTYIVRDPRSAREWHVSPRRYLTGLQERELAVQPDLILQLAHHIARDFGARLGAPVEVRADAHVAWNGRPSAVFVDPTVDLTGESDGLLPKRWILPAPSTTPIRMRPLMAHSP